MARGGLCRAAAIALLLVAGGCAMRVPPPLPATPRYADFVYPIVPEELQATPGAARIDAGWRYLQNGDLRNAEREFAAAARRSPSLYPAPAGVGYVALARRDYAGAAADFQAALGAAPQYVPALVGQGQALLALNREEEALAAFEAALALDGSLTDLQRRVEVLRFRNVQDMITEARTAAAAGRRDEARAGYERALKASPESAFLHRELGILEQQAGNTQAALDHFRRATELDPGDAVSFLQLGVLLEARQDFAGAEAAYRQAARIEPSSELSARIAAVVARGREARLPAAFRAIPSAPAVTRGELAALIGVRLEPLLASAPPQQVVLTDVAGHWAAPWITQVARAGVIEPYANHTFQPRAIVRRGDLAAAASRLVSLIAADRPELRASLSARPRFADLAPGHLSYPAAAVAVASGIMPRLEGDRFQVGRPVTGSEAVAVVDRLRALAAAR